MNLTVFKNKKLRTLASVLALFFLLISISIFGLIVNPLLCLLLFIGMSEQEEQKTETNRIVFACSVLLCGYLFFVFYNKWVYSPIVSQVASILHLPVQPLLIAGGLLLSLLSLNALYSGILMMKEKLEEKWELPEEKESLLLPILVCLVSAFGVIAVCSKSSFIYPFNDWDDPNCFFTVGKSMVNGIVPYRDLFEQKGPLLYFMHGLAWFISHDSFFGVYILESICAFFFLFGTYKTLRIYCDKKVIYLIPVLAAICYTSLPFKDGDSAEELSLPFIIYCLYIFIRSRKNNEKITRNEALTIGVLSGCVFWIKFSLVGIYIGWYLVYAISCVLKKQIKELAWTTLYIAAGVMISTVPYLIYFGVNHALYDWYEVYIYDNIFLYSEESSSVLMNILSGTGHFAEKNKTVFNFCLAGILLSFMERKEKNMWYYPSMMIFMLVLVYMGGRHYRYYSFVMDVFSVCGLICIYKLFLKDVFDKYEHLLSKNAVLFSTVIVTVLVSFYLTPNRYLFGVKREEVPQYHFAQIIRQDKDATLLNYDFLDGGFYTTSGIFPNCKAFCRLNVDLDEMFELQERYVREGLCTYIVSKGEIETDKYRLIEKMTFPYNDTEQTFYLYRLK